MNNEKGVTLIELLLAITIMSIIIVPLVLASGYMLKTQKDIIYQNELQHEALLVMELFSSKIREGAVWDPLEQALLKEVGSSAEQAVLYFDESVPALYGGDGLYLLADKIVSFDVIPIPDGERHSLIVYMTLQHPQTDTVFEMRTQMYERDGMIEYILIEE